MFISSLVANVAAVAALIANMLDGTGPTHSTVKLAQGAFDPTNTSDPADFTIADYDGYADVTVAVWEAPHLHPDGTAETVPTALATFVPTGNTTPNTITGYWMEAADGSYLGGEKFDNPIPMVETTDRINLVVKWQVAPSAWSGTLIA